MSIQDNKQLVQDYMANFGRSDIDGLLAMMTDDFTWTIVGKPHLSPFVGTKSKVEIAELWHGLYEALDGPLTMSVTGMIAEGDQVATEVVSDGRTHDGKLYANAYHFVITLRDGHLAAVREYTDLAHATEIFG
ncbi:nuclear transport factor 2 family protein [Qipengyuania sp. GH25]|uniref:Nuclear transport factor 2 family protein n=1 Tax=Qipengyuania pacifica TaxID=2860199 RepID=A0ABS7JJF8_9SPHN|nr:nuclear transport factor 2 family protein [Qipengyuania aerophila]MBX7489564.1 nuclear transport factor 2 family protein [Qipengyuania aerophila]